MKIKLLLLLSICFCSCSTLKHISYFQDAQIGQLQPIVGSGNYIKILPGDILSIIVSSKDPELAAMFNLPRIQQVVGAENIQGNRNGQISGYLVNSEGNIDFPVLGSLHIEGLAREDISKLIKDSLNAKELLKDAVVTIDYMNLYFSVLGEVARPGQFRVEKDRTTILEALSMAGDLTIYGQRDKVFVTRLVGDNQITYQLDLRTTKIYESPAYFIQQNDLVYVEPNNVKSNQSTVNGNNLRSVSLWMSVASFLTTVGVLVLK